MCKAREELTGNRPKIGICSFGSLCTSHCYLSNPSTLFSFAEDLGGDTNQSISLIVVHRIEPHDWDVESHILAMHVYSGHPSTSEIILTGNKQVVFPV